VGPVVSGAVYELDGCAHCDGLGFRMFIDGVHEYAAECDRCQGIGTTRYLVDDLYGHEMRRLREEEPAQFTRAVAELAADALIFDGCVVIDGVSHLGECIGCNDLCADIALAEAS
jgi:hypothetical protein